MQASQRVLDNHALAFAIKKANELSKPLVVFFGLTPSFPEANERHYLFMLEGLQETAQSLEKQGIVFVIQQISPEKGVISIAKNASLVVRRPRIPASSTSMETVCGIAVTMSINSS